MKTKYKILVRKIFRKKHLFGCHSLDNRQKWIKKLRSNNNLAKVNCNYAYLEVGTFNNRDSLES